MLMPGIACGVDPAAGIFMPGIDGPGGIFIPGIDEWSWATGRAAGIFIPCMEE
jgi:hypothetical protein